MLKAVVLKEVIRMKSNIGKTDRIVRVVIGLIVIAVGYYFSSWWGAIGLLPIFTAAIGWCGLYNLFGISTCKIKG
jgi:predicted RND superfamily exporter protein